MSEVLQLIAVILISGILPYIVLSMSGLLVPPPPAKIRSSRRGPDLPCRFPSATSIRIAELKEQLRIAQSDAAILSHELHAAQMRIAELQPYDEPSRGFASHCFDCHCEMCSQARGVWENEGGQ